MTDHKAEWVLGAEGLREGMWARLRDGSVVQVWRVTVDDGCYCSDLKHHCASTFAAIAYDPASLAAAPAASEGEDVAVDADWPLPCDVHLPPATTITKGCRLGTLLESLRMRAEPSGVEGADLDGLNTVITELRTRPAAQVTAATADAARVRDAMQAVPLGYFNPTGGHSQQENRDAVADALVSALAAVEVAATPKHDEGRCRPMGEDARVPDDFRGWAAPAYRAGWNDRHAAALATQPAARRVTDEDAAQLLGLLSAAQCPMTSQGCDGNQYPVADSSGNGYGEQCQWCYERRAALESFAQPAEGVSGG